jgi:hypothetical protein
MALSAAQKNKIVRLLCYPFGTLVSTSMDYSNIISRNLDLIADEAQTEVELLLESIEQTDTQIDAAVKTAGIKRIDDIEFFGGNEPSKADVLRKEKNRYLRDLSSLVGIPSRCGQMNQMGNICV